MTRLQREHVYQFAISAFTPKTIPMNRLADYMADIASVLGEHESVHFIRLTPGSTRLMIAIEKEAEPKVRNRLHLMKTSDAASPLNQTYRKLNRKLADDNATGSFMGPDGESIVYFPGRERFIEQVIGPFNQERTIDGIPTMVGGESTPIPVHIQEYPDRKPHICVTNRVKAIEIAKLLYSARIRARGTARVMRDADGEWIITKFTIRDFCVLEDTSISDAIAGIRAIPSGLADVKNPLARIREIRGEDAKIG